jgi:predicted nuclease of predicted toxin-antitoxin system
MHDTEKMKLLFDQNISFRIMRLLPDDFADCRHLSMVGLTNHTDIDIYRFAKQNGFTIVTFDADFFDLSLLFGAPPKIVWLRTGNLTTSDIAERIISNKSNILSMIDSAEQSCVEIY